ncbi:uncharacterized protein LOC133479613 isoform X5 [Phyllopteryx taeniolatus]|uniref:uncharacterized protein LOC133479613 isoform X5 n=1 Tax=Phyllopteryx taeniolatus TaxID=161469 RepID=UPI002AD3CE8F|nr:uncharacterized protein LOC133479613 isoform X5 [Phyllopteryx taeniolatus]
MNIRRTMRKTFVCDDSTIITICLGKDSEGRGLAMMPREFSCVFQDMFKVFAYNGFPKPLGAAQCLAGVLIITLNLMIHQGYINMLLIFPSILFVLCGILTYVAGHVPNMCVLPVFRCVTLSLRARPPLISEAYIIRAQASYRNQGDDCVPACDGKLYYFISYLLAE